MKVKCTYKLVFIFIFILLSFISANLLGQINLFNDDFTTSTGATYDVSGAIGTSTNWNLTTSGDDWGARIHGGRLDLTNDASATANVNGWVFGYSDINALSGWNTTLSSNTGTITWEFNIKANRSNLAGFSAGSYGLAFILAGTSTSVNNTGSGYALVLGNSSTPDPFRLVSYNNGLAGTQTTIITSNTNGFTDIAQDYYSVRVTYIPSSNTWELFLRNDGTSVFSDPTSGILTSQGSAVNTTYTSTSGMRYIGGYWQGSSALNQTAFFDNVYLKLTCNTPSIQATSILENYSCANAITLNWTNGNGAKRVIIMNTSNSFTSPANGTDPLANTIYSGSGEQVIYNNNGNNVVVSGLNSSTTYWFRIYEYNCSGSNTVYLTSTGTNNPQSITTPTITCPTSNDYRTITSGNWGINTSWERGTGTGWLNCTSGDFPDVSSANVTIRNGHTIDNDGSGSPPWDVNNLTVETGGKLWDATFSGNNDYIQIYGNIICNGTIGNPSGDDISFDIAGGANTTISGSGSFTATRIRKDQSINSSMDANLIIDMNILLTWNSSSGTVLYNDESSSNFIVTINSGKTLRGTAPGSNVGNISIDGANFSSPSSAQSGGTYTIHGTLDIDGILYAYNNNTTSGRSCNYLIKNGGVIKCRYVVAAPSGTQGNNLTIENGGKLNIFGSVDTITANLNDTTWRYYSTTNNTFNFLPGSIIEYSGATRQLMNGVTNYKNLIISGGSIKNMGTDISVDETLTLTNGIVNTAASKMIIQNNSFSSIIHNISNSISFINGNLRRNISSNTDTYQLPLGYSNSSTGYHPANFLNGNIAGINYIDASVNSIIESGNNVDGNLVTMQQGEAIIDVINLCEWNITPDASINGGNYGVDLFVSNMNMSTSDDNKFVVVKRDDNSTSYADWNSFEGTTFIPSENQAGRITNSGNGFARRTNFTSFSKFAIGRLNNSVLPITVYDFKVNRISKTKNLIEWKSNDEENLLYYELEKSEDGFNYQLLNYTLPLEQNNYTEKHYFVTDSSIIHSANYYKLFSLDNNGKRLYHDVAFINELKSNEDFSIIYSNDGVTILIYEEGVYTDALIYSSIGQLIKKFSAEDLKISSIQLNNSEFATGIYFIQLIGINKTATSKIIIGK